MSDLTEYDGGYIDGLDDALNCIERDPETAAREIREMMASARRWVPCADCDGTGENRNPTTRDLMLAMAESFGGRIGAGHGQCRSCFGEGYLPPQPEANQ